MNENQTRALDLAALQSGVITRSQARVAGLSNRAVDVWLSSGQLVAISSHVYRVRGAPQSERMAITAAALGSEGRASHATAARLLQLGTPSPLSPIHVTVNAAHRHPRLARLAITDATHAYFGVKLHRYRDIAEPVVVVDGIPCTDGARALIDCASMLSSEQLEAAFERARFLGLVSTDELARRFAVLGGRGRPGTPKVRELLSRAEPNALESTLEVKAWRMLRASTLPNPARRVRVDVGNRRWYRLDFAWPESLVAFETEGFEWHGSRGRWKADRVRTAALERLGWRVVVAVWEDVVSEPAATLDRIAIALDAQAPQPPFAVRCATDSVAQRTMNVGVGATRVRDSLPATR